jgi:hypothetical protein
VDKLLSYAGKDSRGVYTFALDHEKNYLEKTASQYHPTMQAYINQAKPIQGKTQLLLTALGASEWWGVNANGDAFPESEIAYEGPEYGFKTFETLAKVFKHHNNKKDSPSYGSVTLSVYNPAYHRVELIVSVDNKDGHEIVDAMEQGKYPNWSMGTKVPYDVCSICANKAPNRKFYCDHLKYELGQINKATGKQVYAINIKPKFFDISYVFVPADKIARTLLKVAYVGHPGYEIISSASAFEEREKLAGIVNTAAHTRIASITKETPMGEPESTSLVENKDARNLGRMILEAKETEAPIPNQALDNMSVRSSLPRIITSFMHVGIIPTAPEFQRMFLRSRGQETLADLLHSRKITFDPLWGQEPEEGEIHRLVSPEPDDEVLSILQRFMGERSYHDPHLSRRILMSKQAMFPGPDPMTQSMLYGPAMMGASPEHRYDGRFTERPIFVDRDKTNVGSAVLSSLIAAAGLYALFGSERARKAIGKVTKAGIDAFVERPSQSLGVAVAAGTASAYAAGKLFRDQTDRSANKYLSDHRGVYSEGYDPRPDFTDPYRRSVPNHIKVGGMTQSLGRTNNALSKVLVGVPAAFLASSVLQRHKDSNPVDDEGRVTAFIRKNPGIVSGAIMTDAALGLKGKGTQSLVDAFKKSASLSEYVAGGIIWPLATGAANLPGRMIGGVLDQAAVDVGSKLIDKYQSRRKKQELP